jgi:hypothetical protein
MELAAHPTRLRNLLREAIHLDLALAEEHPLRVALSIIEAQYRNHRTGLPADTPNPFPPIWSPLIEGAQSPEERMAAFEVATAMTLKRALRNGSASAPHSIDHRNIDDQLMPAKVWQRAGVAYQGSTAGPRRSRLYLIAATALFKRDRMTRSEKRHGQGPIRIRPSAKDRQKRYDAAIGLIIRDLEHRANIGPAWRRRTAGVEVPLAQIVQALAPAILQQRG